MDIRGPMRYLWWLARECRWLVARGFLFALLWFLGLAFTPFLISGAIDGGLQPRDPGALVAWAGAILLLGLGGAGLGIMRHRSMTRLRLTAALRTADLVMTHAARLGSALPRRVTAGEVVTIGIADVWTAGRAMNAFGVGAASLFAVAAVAVLLLRTSGTLASVVLTGVPVMALLIAPLLRRTQRTGAAYRERQGELNTRLADVLGGLRVLNGLGGKQAHLDRYTRESAGLRDLGYRVGGPSSWIGALGDGLPVVFLGTVIWLAARLAATGRLSTGELIAVYGYTAMLAIPVNVLIFNSFDIVRGIVAARRVTDFLRLPADDPSGADGPPTPAVLYDPESGVTAEPGRLTALAGTRPADAAAVLDRLGRYAPPHGAALPPRSSPPHCATPLHCATPPHGVTPLHGVTWGGQPLTAIARPEIRARLVVAQPDAHLFAGPLRRVVAGPDPEPDDDRVRRAIDTAAAHDIATDLHRPIDPDGRNLSGGQQQRLRLARALHADPEMLLLSEPTSAVDAHTETAIAERLATARSGRGTVVATTSPVLLDRADVVHFLVDGRVTATGTHRSLLDAEPGYRALVDRVFGA